MIKAKRTERKRPRKPAENHIEEISPSMGIEDDQMNIYLRLMKTVPIEVKKSDTIKMLRAEFSKLEGVSMGNSETLNFAGDWLENSRKVGDYNVRDGSIINVYLDSGYRIKIHLKIPQLEKTVMLDVDMRDTILAVKGKIQLKEGIVVGQQDLFYLGQELDDRRPIARYNIEAGSTLYAIIREGDAMMIYISLDNDRRKINLNVKNWYKVENVKFLIESMVGIPIDEQKLYFDNREMADQMSLTELRITNGKTLNLKLKD